MLACRGWRWSEAGAEVGKDPKATIKAVNDPAKRADPAQEFMATHTFEPSSHLFDDAPLVGFKPVSMVLVRDADAIKLCNPDGRELSE